MSNPQVIPFEAGNVVKTKLLLLKPGAAPRVFEREMYEKPPYADIRSVIEPLLGLQPMEHVAVLHDGIRLDMFVDEKSALKEMPRNEDATRIYRNNWLTQHPEDDPESLPAIYGPAVLVLRRIWF